MVPFQIVTSWSDVFCNSWSMTVTDDGFYFGQKSTERVIRMEWAKAGYIIINLWQIYATVVAYRGKCMHWHESTIMSVTRIEYFSLLTLEVWKCGLMMPWWLPWSVQFFYHAISVWFCQCRNWQSWLALYNYGHFRTVEHVFVGEKRLDAMCVLENNRKVNAPIKCIYTSLELFGNNFALQP